MSNLPPLTQATYDELLKRSSGTDPVLCWIWKGSVNDEGAPIYGGVSGGREKYVCRRVWCATHRRRSVPRGKEVRHTCGTKSCVNPDHLELADVGDNLRDIHAAYRLRRLRHAPA